MITEKYNEIERVLETYHNNFSQIATDFESVGRMITTLQSESNQQYALTQRVNRSRSSRPSEASSSSVHSSSPIRSSTNSSGILVTTIFFPTSSEDAKHLK